jgi:hypothetical protein
LAGGTARFDVSDGRRYGFGWNGYEGDLFPDDLIGGFRGPMVG